MPAAAQHHRPHDGCARRQVEPDRQQQTQCITRDADAESVEITPPLALVGHQCGHDQAGEHQIDADQLHRGGDGDGEQGVETEVAEALAEAFPYGEQQQR